MLSKTLIKAGRMQFSTFKDKLFDFLTDDPNFCVYIGLNKNLGELPDPGKNKRIANQGKIKMLMNTLGDIDESALNSEDKVDYKICWYLLEQLRLEYELELDGVPMKMRMPNASDVLTGPLFMFFINDPRDAKLRLVNIVSRLEKFPDYLLSYKRNIVEPVQRWVDIELDKCAGIPKFLDNILAWAEKENFRNIERLEKAISAANNALSIYVEYLKNSSKTQNIILGVEQTQVVLNSRGIELSLDELHSIAKNFMQENLSEIERLRLRLCEKYDLSSETKSDELKEFLDKKFRIPKKGNDFQFILDRYHEEREKVMKFCKEKDLFPIMDDQDMLVMQTPEFLEPTIPAGAMQPALAMREGVKKSLVYLTLSEELLAEHTDISIPCMMIHEGIPGHHLQFAWAASHHSWPRKVASFNDLSEGWTTMLEDYMLDQGYAGELEDELRFSGKKDIARIGARVAIDLYFMTGDKKYLDIGVEADFSSEDVFENAGNLLQKVTGFVDGRVAGELNWYSQERGYPLSYLTGNYLVWDLKDKFTQKYPGKSQNEIDKLFHCKLLEAGNMPVSLLSECLLG